VKEDRVDPADDRVADPAVLPGLFARLGAATAAELQRQFCADLLALRQALATALGPLPDLDRIARQAHVLIALAGSAGALGLADQARRLVRVAHRGDKGVATCMATEMLARIDALIDFVAACPLPADGTPR
jgi:two-component system aerobic respiration control sensor histidine kinase ArcB